MRFTNAGSWNCCAVPVSAAPAARRRARRGRPSLERHLQGELHRLVLVRIRLHRRLLGRGRRLRRGLHNGVLHRHCEGLLKELLLRISGDCLRAAAAGVGVGAAANAGASSPEAAAAAERLSTSISAPAAVRRSVRRTF